MSVTPDGQSATTAQIHRVRSDWEDRKARLAKAEEDARWWGEVVTDKRFAPLLRNFRKEAEKKHEAMLKRDATSKEIMNSRAEVIARRDILELLTPNGIKAEVDRLRQDLADFEEANALFIKQEGDAAERRAGKQDDRTADEIEQAQKDAVAAATRLGVNGKVLDALLAGNRAKPAAKATVAALDRKVAKELGDDAPNIWEIVGVTPGERPTKAQALEFCIDLDARIREAAEAEAA